MRFYAGIGSRETPDEILDLMRFGAEALANLGYILRSGHAPGADQAFELGAMSRAEIYLPWPSFERVVPVSGTCYDRPTEDAFRLAEEHHPAWDRLSRGARALHARNAHQVLGRELGTPVSFVLAWTKSPFPQGGTAQAVRIAESHGIRCLNLGEPEVQFRVMRMIEHDRLNADIR